MEKIYLDNFRGFQDQMIPLYDVNFLVGENSTGKSSLLYAMFLLTNTSFWVNQDFRGDEFQIHSFKDIVSIESDRNDYFKIGYISDDNKKTSYILTFTNDNSRPLLSNCVVKSNDEIIVASFKNNKFLYSIASDLLMIEEVNVEDYAPLFKELDLEVKKSLLLIYALNLKYYISINSTNNNEFYGIKPPFNELFFIAPIRTKPKKTYDEPVVAISPEGQHVPYVLRDHLRKNRSPQKIEQIIKFGNESKLFQKIEVKEFDKSSDDAPFQMNVILSNQPLNIVNVGYGVSQSLPIAMEVVLKKKKAAIAIQQPEVHLHPRAQAALGDLFYDAAVNDSKKLYIETHSDFIIDRFRQNIRKNQGVKISSHILYFIRVNGFNKVCSIGIDYSGDYSDDQPDEFRNFFLQEEMNNLGL